MKIGDKVIVNNKNRKVLLCGKIEKFTKKNIWVKRPVTGQILAREYNDILGKTSNKTLPTDYHLKYKDIL